MVKKRQKDAYNQVDDGDDSSTGGQTGAIEFADFLASGDQKRDDELSPAELKRMLAEHQGTHEGRVKKQKALREQRKQVKEGKVSLRQYREGLQAEKSGYPAHPELHDKAQFSGADPQVNALPNENVAETNEENRNEQELQYSLRHRPDNAPKFNPTPQPPR